MGPFAKKVMSIFLHWEAIYLEVKYEDGARETDAT